jgi:hypothetical protein
MKHDTRRHKYLVGYRGEGDAAYDMKRVKHSRHYAEPLTLFRAKQAVKELRSYDVDRVIYELVPVIILRKKPYR